MDEFYFVKNSDLLTGSFLLSEIHLLNGMKLPIDKFHPFLDPCQKSLHCVGIQLRGVVVCED